MSLVIRLSLGQTRAPPHMPGMRHTPASDMNKLDAAERDHLTLRVMRTADHRPFRDPPFSRREA